jgi:crossover junction endodeoxyribonuclease RuvC
MPILGIDPGIAITGYGLIDLDPAGNPIPVKYGVIDSTAVKGTSSLLADYNPSSCGLEKLYFSKNVSTAMAVSEGRGVVQLCLAQFGVPVYEYSPNEVKQAVTSSGRADKTQVQIMVKALLQLDTITRPDDAADALAIALCHQASMGLITAIKQAMS